MKDGRERVAYSVATDLVAIVQRLVCELSEVGLENSTSLPRERERDRQTDRQRQREGERQREREERGG